MALVFCKTCNEAVPDGWTINGIGYHAKHPAPAGPVDPPISGRCCASGGHWAPAIWLVPNDGRHYCIEHLRSIVRVALWKP